MAKQEDRKHQNPNPKHVEGGFTERDLELRKSYFQRGYGAGGQEKPQTPSGTRQQWKLPTNGTTPADRNKPAKN